MKKIKWKDLFNVLKHIFTLKRTRITLYIVAVLWVAVATQVIVNRVFKQEIQITEAFVKSNTEQMKSSLELVADYKAGDLSKKTKKELINKIADSIGLIIEDDISTLEDGTRSEYYYYKQAKKASSEIKVVSINQNANPSDTQNFIIVRLSVLDGIKNIEKYKKLLDNAIKDLGIKNKQITLEYEGNKDGNITKKQKQEIARLLVKELQGEIALEYDEGDIYTVYAYTGMLNEYVTSAGNKINIQIAITYNELTNKTKITLATPVLNENW